ncbi:MAG: hypothetical protein WCG03_10440 [Kiritimatiellales bacterium]
MNYLLKIKTTTGCLLACAAVFAVEPASQDRVFSGASRHECATGEREPLPELTIKQVLDEANQKFTYRCKPVHPKLVKEFQCWDSDLNPVTLAVDVSAASDTNEYTDEVEQRADGFICFSNEEGYYGYRRSGFDKKAGAHILKTFDGGSGTYVRQATLWVKFEIGQSFYPDGKPYDQLILRLIRAF